jgi:hypothetical protein
MLGFVSNVPAFVNLLMPGLWQLLHGRTKRGFGWMVAIILTAPLVLPCIILWGWCALEAFHLESADAAASSGG